jgi:hypothetical protein
MGVFWVKHLSQHNLVPIPCGWFRHSFLALVGGRWICLVQHLKKTKGLKVVPEQPNFLN